MKKFLVTGGAGFIGSHLVEELIRRKYFVRVLDNFSSGKRENLSFVIASEAKQSQHASPEGPVPGFELIEGDIRDKSACDKACKEMDFVLHQAALRSVPKSMKDPASYNEVNINGTLNMLEAALKNKVKGFVFASSSSVYGDIDKFPEKENFLPKPISPYALTKLAGEYYCKIFSLHYGLPCISLRYFNVFGPRQSLDDEYAVVIPKFITCMLKNERPPIFGTGRQSRDFTYVDNVVEANILAARGLTSCSEVFNVANGKGHTVLELVELLNKIIGKDIKPKFLPVRPGDVFRTCADISKIKKTLHFAPKVKFVEGLKLTVEYFKHV